MLKCPMRFFDNYNHVQLLHWSGGLVISGRLAPENGGTLSVCVCVYDSGMASGKPPINSLQARAAARQSSSVRGEGGRFSQCPRNFRGREECYASAPRTRRTESGGLHADATGHAASGHAAYDGRMTCVCTAHPHMHARTESGRA